MIRNGGFLWGLCRFRRVRGPRISLIDAAAPKIPHGERRQVERSHGEGPFRQSDRVVGNLYACGSGYTVVASI